MQKAEETAAEAEAESARGLRLIGEGGVVKLQLFKSVAQCFIIRAVRRIHAAENHRVHLAVAGEGFGCRKFKLCHRIAHFGVTDGFD